LPPRQRIGHPSDAPTNRDLTYFGEAFYRDALPGATTLEDAFAHAKSAIAVREKKEHEIPWTLRRFSGAICAPCWSKAPCAPARTAAVIARTVQP